MEQKKSNSKKIDAVLDKFFLWFYEDRRIVNCGEAFNDATYGKSVNKERFISNKQIEINAAIRDRLNNIRYNEINFNRYFVIVALTPIEEEYKYEIFKPFVDGGYNIVKISEKIEELKGENVYMFDWRK